MGDLSAKSMVLNSKGKVSNDLHIDSNEEKNKKVALLEEDSILLDNKEPALLLEKRKSSSDNSDSSKPKKRKYTKKSKERVLPGLWELCRAMLHNPAYNPKIIHWENLQEGTFRIPKLRDFYNSWHELKPDIPINYEKLTRAMGQYEEEEILYPVPHQRCVYKFGPNSCDWQPSGMDKLLVGDGRRPVPSQHTWRQSRFFSEFSDFSDNNISKAGITIECKEKKKSEEKKSEENKESFQNMPVITITPLDSSFKEIAFVQDIYSKTNNEGHKTDALLNEPAALVEENESEINRKNQTKEFEEVSCVLKMPVNHDGEFVLKIGSSLEISLGKELFSGMNLKSELEENNAEKKNNNFKIKTKVIPRNVPTDKNRLRKRKKNRLLRSSNSMEKPKQTNYTKKEESFLTNATMDKQTSVVEEEQYNKSNTIEEKNKFTEATHLNLPQIITKEYSSLQVKKTK